MTAARHPGSSATVARAARALMVAAATALAAGCGPRAAPESRQSAAPDTAGVVAESLTVRAPLELPAQLYVEHDAVIVARSPGVIDSIYADLGSHVRAGAPLARLESTDQALAAAQADASYENVGRLAARARLMTKAGGTTVADSEQVEYQYRQAELARRKAQRDLELTRIAAPFEGVVTARQARPGRYVVPGDTLFRVTETGPLLVRVRVPEETALAIRVGDRASVVGLSGATAPAAVVHAAPALDPASGTRDVVLRLERTQRFLPGASVTVRLGAADRAVVAVPRDVVSRDGFVVVLDQGREALRPVTLGGDVGAGRVEVVSGLRAGERVARSVTATR